jgi:3-oxoadipate enol-lactonase
MPTAHVNGIDIDYVLEGPEDGPMVVLINGLADEHESWGYQTPAIVEAGFRLLRFDNRGIGKSSKPDGPYSTELLAADAKALVDELGISDFHLMGVSMGGMIAQAYALAHRSDVRSLTLACTYAAPGPFCSRMFAMWADIARDMGVPTVMRDVTLWAFTLDFFRTREAELAEFESEMSQLDQPLEAYLGQLAVIQNHDETARLGALSGLPTLVIAGEEDILIPTRLSHELHELIPGSEWRTTRGGHGCIWEYPDEFNSAFVGFLLEQEGKAR